MKGWPALFLLCLLTGCFSPKNPPAEVGEQDRSTTGSEVVSEPDSYVGIYRVATLVDGKAVDRDSLPPGQRMVMEIKADKTWIMSNMLTGLEGSWEDKGDNLLLVPKMGPAGELKDQTPMVLLPKPDRSHLVMEPQEGSEGSFEIYYDPNAKKDIEVAMRKQMK
jgi:hypothetical protein